MKRKKTPLQRILWDLAAAAGALVGLYLIHVLLGEHVDRWIVGFVVFVFGVRAVIHWTLREYAREEDEQS